MFLPVNKFFARSLVFGALALALPLSATEFNMDVSESSSPCNQRKHHHSSKPKRDVGQSLAFGFEFVASSVDINSTVTPFVVRPDGVLIAGAPFLITAAGTFTLPPISVNNPLYGTYNVGVQTIAGTGVALTVDLLATVQASRDGSTSYVINSNLGLGLTILNAETQTSANFAYGRGSTAIP